MGNEVRVLGKKRAAENAAVHLGEEVVAGIQDLNAAPFKDAQLEMLRRGLLVALRATLHLLVKRG